MKWILNDNQNIDESINPQILTVIFTFSLVNVLFHNITQLCFLEILYRRCVLAPPII